MAERTCKLWEVQRGEQFRFAPDGPVFTFRGMDGMYGRCETEDGKVYPMATLAEVLVEPTDGC